MILSRNCIVYRVVQFWRYICCNYINELYTFFVTIIQKVLFPSKKCNISSQTMISVQKVIIKEKTISKKIKHFLLTSLLRSPSVKNKILTTLERKVKAKRREIKENSLRRHQGAGTVSFVHNTFFESFNKLIFKILIINNINAFLYLNK